jgi:hypothetical protein
MKRSNLALLFCASALVLGAPHAVSATDSPIKLDGCSVYTAAPAKWAAKRLSISFKNSSATAADTVTIDIPRVGTYTTQGKFSQGTLVERDYADNVRFADLPAGALPCQVTSVHFVDGQQWSAGT